MELCKYHHEELPLLSEYDTLVVYAEVLRKDDDSSTLFSYGIIPERVAREKASQHPQKWTQTFIDSTHEHELLFEYEEPGDNSTETLNGMIRRLGVDYQIEELPRDYWLDKIKDFLGTVSGIPSIQEVYLIGGLAREKEASKDADLLLVMDGCESICPLAGIDTNLDIFCFGEKELQQLKSDNFKITENMQLLYSR